ncbi:MAG: hypothetical protein CVU39_27340 [Chloroflexi bacterium HGW-Chloroflexi-10]|nr:MAG: hypothetical protein CVU39_27340 [Chloroflexi bacterium HGW-Chloroflexi-10]
MDVRVVKNFSDPLWGKHGKAFFYHEIHETHEQNQGYFACFEGFCGEGWMKWMGKNPSGPLWGVYGKAFFYHEMHEKNQEDFAGLKGF